jgi:putative membrane protein
MTKLRRCLLGTGLLALIGLGGACAHESKYESARKTGKEVGEAVATKAQFVDQLSLLDKKEAALAELALRKSSTIEVRAFAQQLLENHKQHRASLEEYADASALRLATVEFSTKPVEDGTGGAGMVGVTESTGERSSQYDEELDKKIEEFKSDLVGLAAKSGTEFDKAFLEQVRKDQERARELAEKGLKEYSDDASLALLLARSAPIYERHEEWAKELREALD